MPPPAGCTSGGRGDTAHWAHPGGAALVLQLPLALASAFPRAGQPTSSPRPANGHGRRRDREGDVHQRRPGAVARPAAISGTYWFAESNALSHPPDRWVDVPVLLVRLVPDFGVWPGTGAGSGDGAGARGAKRTGAGSGAHNEQMGFGSGTVTLVFTDVEGSVRLWEAGREAMALASARHNRMVREQVEAKDGRVVTGVGEAFRVVFADPSAALAAAVAVQRAVGAEPWPAARRSGCASRCTRGPAWSATANISVRW